MRGNESSENEQRVRRRRPTGVIAGNHPRQSDQVIAASSYNITAMTLGSLFPSLCFRTHTHASLPHKHVAFTCIHSFIGFVILAVVGVLQWFPPGQTVVSGGAWANYGRAPKAVHIYVRCLFI